MDVGLILMASGFGRRFGGNKLLTRVEGRPLIARAMDAYPPRLFARTAVVSQYHGILSLAARRGYFPCPNPGAREGISASIRAGLSVMDGTDGALFAVCDQPWLTAESVARVIAAFAAQPDSIMALSWQGRKGNPCLFPRALYPELCALTGDRGGGTVIRAHPDRLRLVEARSAQELCDIDAPSDLNRPTQPEG